jgi:hypothetical protein
MSEETMGNGAQQGELAISAGMEDVPVRRRKKAPGEASGTRTPDDAYDTPEPLALACAEWIRDGKIGFPLARAPLVLEPCAGKGPFVRAARQVWPGAKVVAVDIRPECEADCLAAGAVKFACFGATHLPAATIGAADIIISNWPFKLADELARHFWAHMKEGAVMASILSMTFLGSQERWNEGPRGILKLAPLAYVVPIVPRPDFGPTSPKFEAALFVWVKDEQGVAAGSTIIPRDPIRWAKPRRARAKKSENGA